MNRAIVTLPAVVGVYVIVIALFLSFGDGISALERATKGLQYASFFGGTIFVLLSFRLTFRDLVALAVMQLLIISLIETLASIAFSEMNVSHVVSIVIAVLKVAYVPFTIAGFLSFAALQLFRDRPK